MDEKVNRRSSISGACKFNRILTLRRVLNFFYRVEDTSLAPTDLVGNFALSHSDFPKLSGWMRVQLKAIDSYLQAAHADSIKKAASSRFAKSFAVFCASLCETGDAFFERKLPVFDASAEIQRQKSKAAKNLCQKKSRAYHDPRFW